MEKLRDLLERIMLHPWAFNIGEAMLVGDSDRLELHSSKRVQVDRPIVRVDIVVSRSDVVRT
jgi:hypothetical protein